MKNFHEVKKVKCIFNFICPKKNQKKVYEKIITRGIYLIHI